MAARFEKAAAEIPAGIRLSVLSKLVEYRGSMVADGAIRTVPLADHTFEHSGLKRNYKTLQLFEASFRFDPVAGFLNRWYRLARLSDGRQCVSVALDPTLPGVEGSADWACGQGDGRP